ncbi:MAG: bifunctional oligoribonuclease/PAP phosphatase NrnA [Akkermansiaceae bacterium]
MSENATFPEIAKVIHDHSSFILLSHVRPDGDAIGSQIALGHSLVAMGKTVHFINEDGLPDNLAFMPGSGKIQTPPAEPVDAEVCIALDCATKPRLGEKALHAASIAKTWINIDHHISNPRYADLNHIDDSSPATGQIIYHLIKSQDFPLPEETRDAIYVAVSTDTGSFQYSNTTAATYEMAANLVNLGLDVGTINAQIYDNNPYRKIELLRSLLNTLELSEDGRVADWQLPHSVKEKFNLKPEDSEDQIDIIRGIEGVIVAAFFEELEDGKIRVSLRAKDASVNVCEIAQQFGGGGHARAAGIRMPGPITDARSKVLTAVEEVFNLLN